MSLLIALGTTSDSKTKFTNDVLNELNIDCKVINVEAQSQVSSQPMTSLETKTGSINRAKNALAKTPNANIGIGIEAGYDKDEQGNYELFVWVSIVDNIKIVSVVSERLPLPKIMDNQLKNDKKVFELLDIFMEEATTDIQKQLAKDIKTRKPFIKHSLKIALLRYLNEKEYI